MGLYHNVLKKILFFDKILFSFKSQFFKKMPYAVADFCDFSQFQHGGGKNLPAGYNPTFFSGCIDFTWESSLAN